MASLSVSDAWSDTVTFVRRELGLLFPIALAFIALPAAAVQLFAPSAGAMQQPEPGAWMLVMIPIAVLSAIGSLTITALALGRERVVRDAFALALRRFLPLLGAILLLILCLLPIVVIAGMFSVAGPAGTIVGLFLLILALIFVSVRMMLVTPVAAAEGAGPREILQRSWRLTGGRFWRLLGFLVTLILLFVIVTVAVTAGAGVLFFLIAGAPDKGTLAHLLMTLLFAVVNSGISMFFIVLAARIYAQVAGETKGI